MTGVEIAMISALAAGAAATTVNTVQQSRAARKNRRAQERAQDQAERRALSGEREANERARAARRRPMGPVAGMAANRGVGGTTMTGPMGLGGGSTTLGGGTR